MLGKSIPSLKHLASVKIALAVHTHPEVMEFEKKFNSPACCYPRGELWVQFFKKRVSRCPLSLELQENVITFIKSLISELSLWRKNHSEMLIFDPYSINPVWNSFGLIDTLRTAVELVNCKGLHFEQRFTLACYYWLTKEMLQIWKNASPQEKEILIQNVDTSKISPTFATSNPDRYQSLKLRNEFLNKWIEWIKEGATEEGLCYFYCYAISSMKHIPMQSSLLKQANQRLTLDLLEKKLRRNGKMNDMECICFLNLDVKEQEELYKTDPYHILMVFLQWPLQNLFLEVADRLWIHLRRVEFNALLDEMQHKINSGWKDFDYVDLFKKFANTVRSSVSKVVLKEEFGKSFPVRLLCRSGIDEFR
ncbi:uncharacterized protein TNIN_432181 [Trichonephila inaurata madagascariensis]|uniref:Uncharacterized protein n=1 Tax=Trichonephila inaurata madagascariensis TaxID=2747483 RepID=A0A8X6YDU8_9ARAC|nr:uncharacterized protein TNIN_432181 [Trichonephila inaurata madagascariensis]